MKEKMTPTERMWAAIKLEPYDRVPVSPLIDVTFPTQHKGLTVSEGMNWSVGFQALIDVFDEVGGWDGFLIPGWSIPATPRVASGIRQMVDAKYPGGPDERISLNSMVQYEEREVLTREDYDAIIKLGWNGFLERNLERFSPHSKEKIIDWSKKQLGRYIKEIEIWNERKVPTLCGGQTVSPLMLLSCHRSLVPFTMDLYQIPDKVQAVMDVVVDELIQNGIEQARLTGVPGVFIVLERGGSFYYPLKIFERFEFPYMKKMVEAFANNGLITVLDFEQDWGLNLPYLLDLPKKMCVCYLDSKTDIFKAKEILNDHMCISGDIGAGLYSFGTTKEMEEYCKKCIDIVGKGTGFILSSGSTVPSDCKFENFKIMIETAKNYYPYSYKL
jgi:uroporphyrinogen-III decarboxylase